MIKTAKAPLYNWLSADLRVRPDFDQLSWESDISSFEVLPSYGLDWQRLRTLHRESLKPIADLGSSGSSVTVEGYLRGLRIVPVDLMWPLAAHRWNERIAQTMEWLEPYYTGVATPPPGFELAEPLSTEDFRTMVPRAIASAERDAEILDIAELTTGSRRFGPRSFSVVLAGNTVPKHSLSVEQFLTAHLPMILDAAETAAFISPLASFRTEYDDATQSRMSVPDILYFEDAAVMSRVHSIAEERGFICEMVTPRTPLLARTRYHPELMQAATAAFHRVRA